MDTTNEPRLIVGLGNPGPRYEQTRHNVGFLVLDELVRQLDLEWQRRDHGRRSFDEARWNAGGRSIVLIKPQTYMNRSGEALLPWVHDGDGLAPDEVLVAYDDADLAFGRIRLRPSGGSGGHNGLRSLRDVLGGTEFGRIRVGVRGQNREHEELADYVLAPFAADEQETLRWAVSTAAEATRSVIEEGMLFSMNRFNGMKREEAVGEGPTGHDDSQA